MPDGAPLLEPLAQWCASDDLATTADALREQEALAALDWFGAVAAGLAEPAAEKYRAARRLVDPGGGSIAEHAFTLGALSHLAEVDDGHRDAMMHPGIVTFPPLFALAARQPISLGTFRRAVVAGYEAAVRVGAAFGPAHYRRFHTTATAGSFGAAAATAVVLGLDGRQTLDAFGHAGSQAMGVWQFMEDDAEAAKAANPGFAARNGVGAAMLAKSSVPAATRIIEGTRGLAFALGAEIDAEPLRAPFSAATSALAGRTVKAWPVCGQMHHVLDAVRDRITTAPLDPNHIECVEVESFEALKRIADLRDPVSPGQARFSTAWCLAHLLVHGELGFETFRGPAVLQDSLVKALAGRIVLKAVDAFTAGYPRTRRCRVTVTLRDGSEVTWEQTGRRGDPERPFSRPQMLQRFEDIAAPASAQWRARALDLFDLLLNGSAKDTVSLDYLEPVINAG